MSCLVQIVSSPSVEQASSGTYAEAARNWYAVYTLPRHEKSAARQMRNRSIENFVPVYRAIRTARHGERSRVEYPLFPGYLFARISRAERLCVLTVPGVIRLVGTGGCPTPIAEDEIEGLRTLLSSHGAEPVAYMTRGRRVRFADGPWSGLEGTVIRTKTGARVVVSVDLIRQSIAIEVDSGQLELLLNSAVHQPQSRCHSEA